MKRLAIPALLASIAAVQLNRIEPIAAQNPPVSRAAESAERSVSPGADDQAQAGSPDRTRLMSFDEWIATPRTRQPIEEEALGIEVEGAALAQPAPASPPHSSTAPRPYREDAWPRYVIEPPDILQIDGVKLVPRAPYRIETFDEMLVRVRGDRADQPIDDLYAVAADGTINFGPPYGRVLVAGLTVDDAEARVRVELAKHLADIEVTLSLQKSAGFQNIAGQHLVAMDGRVNLGIYGSVFVAGMTIEEARAQIEKKLAATLDEPQVSVDVIAYNSKVYYVILKGARLGDDVTRLPCTGKETVLDAIASLGGIRAGEGAKLWLARPAAGGIGPDQILPVAWSDIAAGNPTDTNYQLLTGDRLFIQPPPAEPSVPPADPATTSATPAPPAAVVPAAHNQPAPASH